MKNKKMIKALFCTVLAVALFIGTAFAFLQAHDSRVNRFTKGTLTLELTEENWEEVNAIDMVPMQTVSKDPRVENPEGNIEAWIMSSVKVPSANVPYDGDAPVGITADKTVLKSTAGEYYDLFNYTVNDGWELVAADATHRNEPEGYTIYYYVYTADSIAGGETTTALFDEVQLNNITKRPDTYRRSIDIDGYGMQKDNVDSVYKAWSLFANQNSYSSLTFYNNAYSYSSSNTVLYS